MTTDLSSAERSRLRSIATYQFGPNGTALLDKGFVTTIDRRSSGRIDRLYANGERIGTLTTSGRFTLGIAGGHAIHGASPAPRNRVSVTEEAVPYVSEGSNAFAKFIVRVDPRIRPRDEVVLTDTDDRLLGVGRAELSAEEMETFDRGMAVAVRQGIEE